MKKVLGLLVGLVLLALIIAVVYAMYKPLDSQITIDGLRAASQKTEYILVKDGEEYFEIQGSEEFSDLFDFDAWQRQQSEPQGEAELIIRFAEAWIVEFYPDGLVRAHNGYAPRTKRADAYYSVSIQTANTLSSYFRTNGTEHTLGDGAIGKGTFHE